MQKYKPIKSDRETYCKITSEDFFLIPEDQQLSKLCSGAKFESGLSWTIPSMRFRHRMERRINLYAENTRHLEMKRKIVQKGGSKAVRDSALSRT